MGVHGAIIAASIDRSDQRIGGFVPLKKLSKRMGIPVIDLFAGPGGLCEGFSSIRGQQGARAFDVKVSIEKDAVAHRTLTLRALFRSFAPAKVPKAYYDYVRGDISKEAFEATPEIAQAKLKADTEARLAELGKTDPNEIDGWITDAIADAEDWVLIGGPPCQAYSLAGRARMRGRDPEKFEADERHFLYREYLRIIAKFSPSIFVMENVKGILTSSHSGSRIFEKILKDLKSPRKGTEYLIRSLVVPGEIEDPADFVIKSENHGIPQNRHRVILLGIRSDIAAAIETLSLHPERYVIPREERVTVGDVIKDLPPLRSRLSSRMGGRKDSSEEWQTAVGIAARALVRETSDVPAMLKSRAQLAADKAKFLHDTGGRFVACGVPKNGALSQWYADSNLGGVTLHEARSHMESDLGRYLFAASFSAVNRQSPKLRDFPAALLPAHENVESDNVPFKDRFRVQLEHQPASTIVSHIAKDGHYYIHFDPGQCRSLTVREAARLQTFPDNYFFEGNRTEQYHQVGNAVPPLLAKKIGEVVLRLLGSIRR